MLGVTRLGLGAFLELVKWCAPRAGAAAFKSMGVPLPGPAAPRCSKAVVLCL